MKDEGRKIVGVVVYDHQMARVVDRAGVDIVSVGDSVGMNMWAHTDEHQVTLDEMLLVCRAVHCGIAHALVSCDVPVGVENAMDAARRLVHEGGAEMVKLDAPPDAVREIVNAGIPVWAQLGTQATGISTEDAVQLAARLEEAGASMLDFRHSGPIAGPAVSRAVSIPVIGGLGGGPWLDGRVRLAHTAIGYAEKWIDATTETYGNAAKLALDALRALAEDVRSGRQIKGG